jgi:alpha-ribazole phosphatase
MKLHLVRHPRPAVATGVCYGASDVAVADSELDAAVAALRAAGLPGDLPVYASPLRRCAALARRLQPRRLHLDVRLAEMDFGAWELQRWDVIPRAAIDAWTADLLHYRPGGAENVLDVARRVAAFAAELRASGEPEAMVICHAGTIRLLCAMQRGVALDQAAFEAAQTPHRIGYGAVILLQH